MELVSSVVCSVFLNVLDECIFDLIKLVRHSCLVCISVGINIGECWNIKK